MKYCSECNKKLGFMQGYVHPTMGRHNLLCSNCYDQLSTSVQKWTNFVKRNSFDIAKKSNIDLLSSCHENLALSHMNFLNATLKLK